MLLTNCFLLFVLSYKQVLTLNVLNYVLDVIEFEASVHPSVLTCVFYDIDPYSHFSDNIWVDLLRSPRLDHVVKYVIRGGYQDQLDYMSNSP